MRKILKHITYVSLATVLLTCSMQADDITETLQEAMASYEKGDYVQTKEDLVYAMELLKQKKGDSIKMVLPDALSGWEAEEATSETAGAGCLVEVLLPLVFIPKITQKSQ